MDAPIYDGWTAANVVAIGFPEYMQPLAGGALALAIVPVALLALLAVAGFRLVAKLTNRGVGK